MTHTCPLGHRLVLPRPRPHEQRVCDDLERMWLQEHCRCWLRRLAELAPERPRLHVVGP